MLQDFIDQPRTPKLCHRRLAGQIMRRNMNSMWIEIDQLKCAFQSLAQFHPAKLASRSRPAQVGHVGVYENKGPGYRPPTSNKDPSKVPLFSETPMPWPF